MRIRNVVRAGGRSLQQWSWLRCSGAASRRCASARAGRDNRQPRIRGPSAWPKQLPERWVTGELGGVCVDANDHVFVLSQPTYTRASREIAQPAPPVMEFDQAGNVVNSWGNRDVDGGGAAPDAPIRCRGATCGSPATATASSRSTRSTGKLLLRDRREGRQWTSVDGQAGSRLPRTQGPGRDSTSPADVAVESSERRRATSPDGYGNKRVAGLRQDREVPAAVGAPGDDGRGRRGRRAARCVNIVHCVVLGNDGLLYVCDRNGDGSQVFDEDGGLQAEHSDRRRLSRAVHRERAPRAPLAFSRDGRAEAHVRRRLQRQSDSRLRSRLGKGALALRPPG